MIVVSSRPHCVKYFKIINQKLNDLKQNFRCIVGFSEFEEENEPQEAVYNPAAWAEIAYDIQAFVKTSDTAAEKRSEELKPSKYDIITLYNYRNP